MNLHYQQREKSGETAAINFIPNRFSSQFSTSPTNGPRLPSLQKAGTHSAFGERSHTSAYTPKQGVFQMGCYYYPRTVSHVSENLRGQGVERQTVPLLGLGRGHSRRTQRACGTAMRLCASLSRRRRGPAGLRDPIAVSLTAPMGFAVLLSRIVGAQKIERLFFSYSGAFFEPLFASIHARNLSFGTTIRLPILSAGKPSLCASS